MGLTSLLPLLVNRLIRFLKYTSPMRYVHQQFKRCKKAIPTPTHYSPNITSPIVMFFNLAVCLQATPISNVRQPNVSRSSETYLSDKNTYDAVQLL